MNTTRTRTMLVTATVGCMVLGIAGAAAAHQQPAPGPKPAYIQLRTVDIHRHSPINVSPAAVTRGITVRASVWDSVKGADPTAVTVVLAQYDRRRGTEVEPSLVADFTVDLAQVKSMRKNAKYYRAFVPGAQIRDAVAAGPGLATGASMLLCIQSAVLTAPDGVKVRPDAKMVTKKEKGGDCVRIVNMDPTKTRTPSDDKPAA